MYHHLSNSVVHRYLNAHTSGKHTNVSTTQHGVLKVDLSAVRVVKGHVKVPKVIFNSFKSTLVLGPSCRILSDPPGNDRCENTLYEISMVLLQTERVKEKIKNADKKRVFHKRSEYRQNVIKLRAFLCFWKLDLAAQFFCTPPHQNQIQVCLYIIHYDMYGALVQ